MFDSLLLKLCKLGQLLKPGLQWRIHAFLPGSLRQRAQVIAFLDHGEADLRLDFGATRWVRSRHGLQLLQRQVLLTMYRIILILLTGRVVTVLDLLRLVRSFDLHFVECR